MLIDFHRAIYGLDFKESQDYKKLEKLRNKILNKGEKKVKKYSLSGWELRKDCRVLRKLVKDMLRQAKEESYYTFYGEGFKAGKIEGIEEILKLI